MSGGVSYIVLRRFACWLAGGPRLHSATLSRLGTFGTTSTLRTVDEGGREGCVSGVR